MKFHNKTIHLTGIPAGDGRRYGQKKEERKDKLGMMVRPHDQIPNPTWPNPSPIWSTPCHLKEKGPRRIEE